MAGLLCHRHRCFLLPVDSCHDLFEALYRRFEIFDYVARQQVRVGQVIEVGEAFVFEPGNVEAGLVAAYLGC